MKTKLISLLILVLTVSYFDLSGQCTNCDQSTNNGTNSSALGLNNHASGFASFAVGAQSTTSGVSAISLGSFNTVEADYSTVIGSYLRANETASESVLIGSGANDKYILENNQTACLLVGFRSDKPTLFVGTSPEWHKTGKIGIGNMTNPQAKLHIYSDDDESATLFLQPSNWTTEFNAQLWLGNQNHGISAHVEKGLVFDTENHFVFNNGYLGLGTYEPTALLDVNGSARIRSLAGNGERNIVVDSAGNLSATAFSGQCIVCDNPPVGANANIIGINSTAQGVGSVAIGQGAHTLSTAGNSIAIGSQTKTVAGLSIVIGHGFSQDNMLTNYINRSLMVGFDSDVPTFFVGRSGGLGKTGKIGIGNITAPEAKLHIYSDDDESATLFLQPTIWGGDYNAQIWLGNQNHGISAELDEGLVFETENSFVFRNGDVYLEDIDKGIIMKSPDGRCWRGVLDNNGSLSFTVLETCPNGLDAIPEQGSLNNDNGLKVYPNPTNKYLTIELKENVTSPIIVRLLDEKGVELISKQTTNSSTQIFTGDLSPGVYFLSVTVDGKHLVEKVIKQ